MLLSNLILSTYANLPVYWWLPLAAVILDRLIGDPPKFPHPVRAVGALLARVEPRARRAAPSPFQAGLTAMLAALAVTYIVTRASLLLPLIGTAAALYLAFAGLALGQLLREGRHALTLIESGDTPAARIAVGHLVSRDVSRANPEELRRVLAETLSENLNDGFTAPLFWLIAGGPVALWLYKAVSTMDSTWGYPHEPWTRFGTPAARLDDALAWIPARLTALFLVLAANILRLDTTGAAYAAIRDDAKTMKSPNAGWPMAACARILGAAMGGKAVYAGKTVDKPVLGPAGTAWTPEKLRTLLRLLDATGWLALAALWGCGMLFSLA